MSLSDKYVECIKRVDVSKDFSSWHIKWKVGKITDDDLDAYKESPKFHIPPTDNKNDSLRCWFSMWIPKDEADPTDILLNIWNLKFPTPMIYRFALSYDDHEMVLASSCIGVHMDEDWYLPSVEIDGSLFKRKSDHVVHCWLDIPSAVFKKIESNSWGTDYSAEFLPSNINNLFGRLEALYRSTMKPNRDFTSHSDVTLVLSGKSNKRFYCHRNILASASPMFATMFSATQWKEGEDGTVEIDDIDEKTMKAVLYHIYTGQFKQAESQHLTNLIYAADKYQLEDLKAWGEIQLMVDDSTDSERIDCLLFAERHQLHRLRAACIAMLSTNVRLSASDEVKEKLSKETREELIKAVEKRQVNTIQINI